MRLVLSAMYLWDRYGIIIAFAFRSFDPFQDLRVGERIY